MLKYKNAAEIISLKFLDREQKKTMQTFCGFDSVAVYSLVVDAPIAR